MSELAHQKCVPCSGGVPTLTREEIDRLTPELKGWRVVANHHLTKRYDFDDFKGALQFVNQVGAIAEDAGHHPDIALTWGMVGLEIFTHKIDGLTESDFVLAAKIDQQLS